MRIDMIAVITLFLATATTAATPGVQPPFTSRAQLTHYLQTTPISASPLGALSPGGRKRFLAELQFGSHGLRSIPLDDPEHELTHRQIVKLFRLFGVGKYVSGLGLTPREHPRRQHERKVYAKVRGCKPGNCPESPIEQDYDALMLRGNAADLPLQKRIDKIARIYGRRFTARQTGQKLKHVSRPDLRLLKRAAETVVSYAPDPHYIAQLRLDVDEMQRRGMTRDKDFTSLYRALVTSRQFNRARELARQHPGMGAAPLPAWRPPSGLPKGQPTALSIDADSRTMTRQAFDLSAPLTIVVVASCHFSQDAARDIRHKPVLRKLFSHHAIWLAAQNESISEARDWNREFAQQPIHIAWKDSEWPMLDSWAMPTFYLFRHGKLVDRWSGWPADAGMQTLRRHLRKDGVPKPYP
jgi:hypothetical protein